MMSAPMPGKYKFKSSYQGGRVGHIDDLNPPVEEDDKVPNGPIKQKKELRKSKQLSPQRLWKVNKRGVDDGQIFTPIDVGFFAQGLVVVSEFDNERLQIFNSKGESLLVVGEGELKPRGIATDKISGNIAVVEDHYKTVKLFTCDGDTIGMWKKNLFGKPNGIAVTNDDMFVITDLADNKPKVSLYEPDGQVIITFGQVNPENANFIKQPNFAAVDQHDRVIISDYGTHCIKVFDLNGKFLMEFGKPGSGDGEMKYPNGICTDLQNNILVADNGNHRISLYSPAGKFIQHILTEDDGIAWPEGVAVDDSGMLAITEFGIDQDCVQVFQVK